MRTLIALTFLVLAAPLALAGDPTIESTTSKDLPKGVKAKGATVVNVMSWEEGKGIWGHGVFSVTETLSKEKRPMDRRLYVQLFQGKAGALKELRLVQDGAGDCEDADLTADFVADSIQVWDQDLDGKIELSFAYDLACRTDVSPATRKLLVLEGANKHILRGTERIEMGEDKFGGEFTPEGFKGEDVLKKFAERRWAELNAKKPD